MNHRRQVVSLLAVCLLVAACGYVPTGTWQADPANWKRSFGSVTPADVTIIHSEYWRSPHWSFEYQYFFEIAPNAKLRERLLTENKLRRATGDNALRVKQNIFGHAPEWFAPKAVGEYDVWVFENEPERNFKVLIDRKSGRMFLHDYQV
jgi:hypothetical protein